tara:strand:- start:44 stop:841 length:798 start_codon:yes stop_codon:yes gene_type:complete
MKNLEIYCVTNKLVPHIEKTDYKLACVGKENFPNNYIKSNTGDNIFFKEKYYSELTFHYWFWKNLLPNIKSEWIGFCQKRRFWIKSASEFKIIKKENLYDHLLFEPENDWNNYEAIITKPISLTNVKISKIFKRGFKSLVKSPSILFNKRKRNIKLHFDMHHGHGNLDKAINLINDKDRHDFKKFVEQNSSFNPHIMFISKPKTIYAWFDSVFEWLNKCENEFGFKNLTGYDSNRLYAYLAERYLSFWFKKYTRYKEQPWILIDN